MTEAVDTSKEAVEPVAKDIAGLASREAVTMVQGWEDAFYLYRKTADILRALLAERDQLRREVEEARDKALSLEAACDAVAGMRTQEMYLAMIDAGQQKALEDLDDARRAIRALKARP